MAKIPNHAREDAELEAGAERYETTVSGFIRMAVKAALAQQAMLLPEEREAFGKALEQFRQAAVNLNSLLRQTYLFQDGVMDHKRGRPKARHVRSYPQHSLPIAEPM